ncbi:hypothetical protein QFC21_001861 [Naganishia friedmannii]|uniref:Uncharacterized protein n=1 Tax=Naganishia friedmannii TaxID=89922 RepID=A0ACC2W171_9TREE|nr:hypothetical protein QFC21_001861 [Naganishia friedmannii]
MSTTRSLVPAAAGVIVDTLRAGPLTWKELWKQCSSSAAAVGASAGPADQTPLQRSFQSKSNLKKRILPTLLAQGLIERHALTSSGKSALDPQERAARLTEKLVFRHNLSLGQTAAAAAAAHTNKSTATTTAAAPGSRSTTEFVYAVPHALLPTSAQHPTLSDPRTTARLEQHLDALTTGRETPAELSAHVRALRAGERVAEAARERYSVPTLQQAWARPVGVVVSGGPGGVESGRVGGAQWVTSRGEKRYLSKRRAGARIGKERRVQVWWDALGEAKKQGERDALA